MYVSPGPTQGLRCVENTRVTPEKGLLVQQSENSGWVFNNVCVMCGYNNKQYDYFMGKECIETTHEERDLGVIITETLDVTEQCVRAANKANAMLGMINRAFKYKTKEVVLKLYKSLVRRTPP